MRTILILLIAVVAFSSSCKKKSTDHTKTYYCVTNDSLHSTISVLSNPHFKVKTGYYSHYTESQIAMFVRETNSEIDTFFNRHDTLSIVYRSITCDAVE